VWPPAIVPDLKFVAQFSQMINAFDEKISGKATAEMIGLKHQVSNRLSVIKNNERQISFYAEPYSFSTIRISQ
jgi:hypothetical protein